jgi:hypothetical protein
MTQQRPSVQIRGARPVIRLKGVRQNVVKLKGQRPKVRIKGNWRDYPQPKG